MTDGGGARGERVVPFWCRLEFGCLVLWLFGPGACWLLVGLLPACLGWLWPADSGWVVALAVQGVGGFASLLLVLAYPALLLRLPFAALMLHWVAAAAVVVCAMTEAPWPTPAWFVTGHGALTAFVFVLCVLRLLWPEPLAVALSAAAPPRAPR